MLQAMTRSLQSKLILALVLAVLIPTTIISVYTDRTSTGSLIDNARQEESSALEVATSQIVTKLGDAENNLLFVSQTSTTKDYANLLSGNRPTTDKSVNAIAEAQTALLRSFLTNTGGAFRNIYVLDAQGHLRLGVDNKAGTLAFMGADDHEGRAKEPYFSEAANLIPGQVYGSNVELSMTKGTIEKPYAPIIYYATPIFDDYNNTAGVIVSELDVHRVFATVVKNDPDQQWLIVESDGSYLWHPASSKLYGRMLGHRARLSTDQPQDATVIFGKDIGDLVRSQERPDTFQTFTRITPPDQPNIDWRLVKQRSLHSIYGAVSHSRRTVFVLSLVLLMVALVVGSLLVRRIVQPIRLLYSTAQAIMLGNVTQHVAVTSKDELGQLAVAFNEMATAIQKRETELRQQAEELRMATAQAKEASRLKDEFLAVMSHELRTPLNAIIGFAGILSMSQNLDPPVLHKVRRIRSNGERLLALINDILDISRIESGRMQLTNTPIAIRQFVERLEAQMSVLGEEKGLAFHVQVEDAVPQLIEVDQDALMKITTNLLSNAFKFTEKGEVSLQVLWQGRTLVIQVSDTGIGIPAPMHEMVVYLSPADNSPRLTRRLSQGLKVLDEWALMTSQQPSEPW
jgi:signal transduction histidine kinase